MSNKLVSYSNISTCYLRAKQWDKHDISIDNYHDDKFNRKQYEVSYEVEDALELFSRKFTAFYNKSTGVLFIADKLDPDEHSSSKDSEYEKVEFKLDKDVKRLRLSILDLLQMYYEENKSKMNGTNIFRPSLFYNEHYNHIFYFNSINIDKVDHTTTIFILNKVREICDQKSFFDTYIKMYIDFRTYSEKIELSKKYTNRDIFHKEKFWQRLIGICLPLSLLVNSYIGSKTGIAHEWLVFFVYTLVAYLISSIIIMNIFISYNSRLRSKFENIGNKYNIPIVYKRKNRAIIPWYDFEYESILFNNSLFNNSSEKIDEKKKDAEKWRLFDINGEVY